MPGQRGTPEERFWRHVDVRGDDECWPWTGYIMPTGYGLFDKLYAHRFSYVLAHGPIERSMDVDHQCHTEACRRTLVDCPHRRCVNPAHLAPLSRRDNLARGNTIIARQLAITHCPKGHPYDEENTVWDRAASGNPARKCRTCRRQQRRDRAAARRASG